MTEVTITFDNKPNESLQVGDWILRTETSDTSGFNVASSNVEKYGVVKSIAKDYTDVDGSLVPNGDWLVVVDKLDLSKPLSTADYVLFLKDSRVNLSGVTGYYAEGRNE
jgi:hypothetical protein